MITNDHDARLSINDTSKTKQLYDKLNNVDSTKTTTQTGRMIPAQLIYPNELASVYDEMDHPGHAVIFTIYETEVASKTRTRYVDRISGSKDIIKIDGYAGRDVFMDSKELMSSPRREVGGLGGRYLQTNQSIVLPPPQKWTENNVINWQSTQMGVIKRSGDYMDSVFKSIANGGNANSEAWDQSIKAFANATTALIQKFPGGPNLNDYTSIEFGMTENNYDDHVFRNVNNRIIPIQYTFVPKDEKESQTIRDIIHRFRYHALPQTWKNDTNNNAYLLAPSSFGIFLVDLKTGKEIKWQNKIGPCVLTSISTDTTPNGSWSVMKNGAPAAITIELLFTELFVLTKNATQDPDSSY